MNKIGRNDLCPCGSGKKYKKCCMSLNKKLKQDPIVIEEQVGVILDDLERLESLSNEVSTLIQCGDIEKAEENCRELLRKYPDQVDGLHRLAEVYTARGDIQKAIKYYNMTIDFMKTHPGFDQNSIAWIIEEINKLKAE